MHMNKVLRAVGVAWGGRAMIWNDAGTTERRSFHAKCRQRIIEELRPRNSSEHSLGSYVVPSSMFCRLTRRNGALLPIVFLLLAASAQAAACPALPLLDQGYRLMYDLKFAQAHRTFAGWERIHPDDPMGPISDAAAYLFAELDRLHVLQSEFFTDDDRFLRRERGLAPDPVAKRNFEDALERGERLASATLARVPEDENALFAMVLKVGLHSDYLSLIEKRNLDALSEVKRSRSIAERLLALHPDCYDAYLAVGIENYLLGLKPLPLRWLLRLGGAQTDKQTGINRLRVTAEKGRYLKPYARLLLAVAALRENHRARARDILEALAAEFPDNRLYRKELLKLR